HGAADRCGRPGPAGHRRVHPAPGADPGPGRGAADRDGPPPAQGGLADRGGRGRLPGAGGDRRGGHPGPAPRHAGAAKYLLDVAFARRDRLTLGSYAPSFASAWQQVGGELAGWRETSVLWDPAGDRRRVLVAAIAGLPQISISIFGGMNPPNPPWYRRWSFILAGVIGLAAIAALVGWRGLQEFPPDTTRPTVAASPTTTTTTNTPPPPLQHSTTPSP